MNEILSVSELTLAIKKQLEARFNFVSVRGEVSNFKEQSSGHLYFTLKDKEAQIAAVLFKGNTRGLPQLPKNGDQIIVRGELSIYPPRGNYQIIIREIQYAGVGELLLKLHELKCKLEQRGWFAKERKRPLPKFPKTIGVVTSPTGSVIQDILQVLSRRFSGFHLILNPVRVQGEGAAQEIAAAIEAFNRHGLADLLIVGRGGGSLEDLWAFNEERVAAAIVASKIPIISAVGHETDVCIADFVADVRAPTPSAAAEIAIGEKAHHIQRLFVAQRHLKDALRALILQQKRRLEVYAKQPLFSSPYAILSKHYQLLDDFATRVKESLFQQLKQKRFLITSSQKQLLLLTPKNHIQRKMRELAQLTEHLRSIDPRNLLTKGYSILFQEKEDCVILSTQELAVSHKIRIRLQDGQALATIDEIKRA
jgi:exodeoxyribonuclease VII large subunit